MVHKYNSQSALRAHGNMDRPIRSPEESARTNADASSRFSLQLEDDRPISSRNTRSDATNMGGRYRSSFSSEHNHSSHDNTSRLTDSSVEPMASTTSISAKTSNRYHHYNQPPAISGQSSARVQAISHQHVSDFDDTSDEFHQDSVKLLHLGDVRISALKSLRNLRAWFKDASAQDIDEIQQQLERLKIEKINEAEEQRRKEAMHQAFVKLYRNDGNFDEYALVDPQSLVEGIAQRLECVQAEPHKNKHKYRFIDLEGKICEWTGQGREPKRLKAIMAATGKPKEAFLAKEEQLRNADNIDTDEIKLISNLVAKMSLLKRSEDMVQGRHLAADKAHKTHRPLL